jgi:hypothetical protein
MVSLGKMVFDVKLIQKILRSFPERFWIKFTTIEESKDLESMKIEELVGSLQTYVYSLPPIKKAKEIALKASKKKARVSFEKDFDNEEEDVVAMLAKNFGRLMKNEKLKKKFSERLKKVPRESEPEEAEKKDPRGPGCFECSSFGHILADYEDLKQDKGKAYKATLSDEEEDKTPCKDQKFLAFVAPHEDQEDYQSYYSERSDEDGEELKEAYKVLYIKFLKLTKTRQHMHEQNEAFLTAQDSRSKRQVVGDTATVGEGH